MRSHLYVLFVAPLLLLACGEDDPQDTQTPTPSNTCSGSLPQAERFCTDSACSATSDDKVYGQYTLDPAVSKKWLVVSYVGSDIQTDNVGLKYGLKAEGALSRAGGRLRKPTPAPVDPQRAARIAAEARIRAMAVTGPLPDRLAGTHIEAQGSDRKAGACSAAAPKCEGAQLCVIPAGTTTGSCADKLTIKWRDYAGGTATFQDVAATVKAVGEFGAIVVDDAATVSDTDVTALLKRFDEHIAPLDHAFFGKPVYKDGKDRDQNGVVILFLTDRIEEVSTEMVGFFDATDIGTAANANGADLLYMRPPSPKISLNQLSGTIGHEYQHLINYLSKKSHGSDREEVWLDEGLSTFAEDMLGYGEDSFKNIAAYLSAVGSTSLTGAGTLGGDPDSIQRRGMAHLLVRYYFQANGGASFGPGPAELTDNGGVAAIQKLVNSDATGMDLFSESRGGIQGWVRDLLITVAINGADYPKVSCLKGYQLGEPEEDAYTHYQRGINLRKSLPGITLNGPATTAFEAGDSIVPVNAGEVFTLDLTTAKSEASVSAAVYEDFGIGLVAIPIAPEEE